MKNNAFYILFAFALITGSLLYSSRAFSDAPADLIRYDAAGRKDPFIPLVGPGGIIAKKALDSSGFGVEGIVFDPKAGSIVLINGEAFKKGDKVKDAEITEIFRNRVILSKDGEDITVWFQEDKEDEGAHAKA